MVTYNQTDCNKVASGKVKVVACFDSFIGVAEKVAPHFRRHFEGIEWGVVAPWRQYLMYEMSREKYVSRVSLPSISRCADWLLSTSTDVCLISLPGRSTEKLIKILNDQDLARPAIVSLYPGLVLRYPFDGLAARCLADFLWLNCDRDYRIYQSMCNSFDLGCSNARILGPPALLQQIRKKNSASRPVVFFEQTIIPRSRHERVYLTRQLVALATRFERVPIAVKPRVPPGGRTLHRTLAPIEPLLREAAQAAGGWPDNLSITYEPVAELLATMGHCLTISSTVAVEAIHNGIPTTIITDFGAHDDLGTSYFFGSGLLRRFSEVDFDNPPRVEPRWQAEAYADPNPRIDGLVQEVLDRVRSGERPTRPLNLTTRAPELEAFLQRPRSAREFALETMGRLRRLF